MATGFLARTGKRIHRDRYLLILFAPVFLYYMIFRYLPIIGGFIISFTDYTIYKGIFESSWAGVNNFNLFFKSIYFFRLIGNTLILNIYQLLFAFPAPIIFALLLNELRSGPFKRIAQTISYLPYFISAVIVVSLMLSFLSPSLGLVNNIIAAAGGERIHFLARPEYFRTIYTIMTIWQGTGFGAIIYLAALSGINPELYEAAIVDGAGRIRQLRHITMPSLAPTIVILLLMRIGHLLEVGFENIILMYNPAIYQTADVINTYVYRRGILDADYSFATSVGLFQGIIGLILIVIANRVARSMGETSIW